MQLYLIQFAPFYFFLFIKIWFWFKHESKLVLLNRWESIGYDLHVSTEELVKPLHENCFSKKKKKPFIVKLYNLLHLWKENSIWLTYDTPKKFPLIVWYYRDIEHKFRVLFEWKINYKKEDINESFKDSIFTHFWTPKIFL